MQVGCACKCYPSPSLDGNKSIRFKKQRYLQQKRKINEGIHRDQNKSRAVRMHQMSMGVRCCTDSYHNTQKRITGVAHARTVNYEIRDPALRVGGG